MKHLKQKKLNFEETKGVIELYKNNKRIRHCVFNNRKQRRTYMKRFLEHSDTTLNNYHFLIKLNTDELL